MPNPRLHPCPFCGEAIHIDIEQERDNLWYFGWCDTCFAQGPGHTSPSKAEERWNTRNGDSMSKPHSKAEARWYTDLWESKFISMSKGYVKWVKRQLSKARRRADKQEIERDRRTWGG